MRTLAQLLALAFALNLTGCQLPDLGSARWTQLATGTESHFRGLHVVDDETVWASGSAGTILRTTDGGASFQIRKVPGEAGGELRDIHAFDALHAVFLACQPARIYRTRDGGQTFQRLYESSDEQAFLDGIDFFDGERGLAFGDAIGKRFQLLRTTDGGDTWQQVADAGLPVALPGEGGFAASGTCLTAHSDGRAWIVTGIAGARVFHSADFGQSWSVVETPLVHGPSAGVFSLACSPRGPAVVVGGDYKLVDETARNAATSTDGGVTWQAVGASAPPRGFRSCVAWVPGYRSAWVAAGESGTDLSNDDGRSWSKIGDRGYHVVGFSPNGVGYAAGAGGRFARLELRPR